jgi:hypothetical protein
MANQPFNLGLTIGTGILLGAVAMFCLAWPKAIRDSGLKAAPRKLNWLIR